MMTFDFYSLLGLIKIENTCHWHTHIGRNRYAPLKIQYEIRTFLLTELIKQFINGGDTRKLWNRYCFVHDGVLCCSLGSWSYSNPCQFSHFFINPTNRGLYFLDWAAPGIAPPVSPHCACGTATHGFSNRVVLLDSHSCDLPPLLPSAV